MEIPIACTLQHASARAQADEWRGLLARLVERSERIAPDALRLWLKAEPEELAELISLAQRERACCGFFRFSLEIDAGAVIFLVGVPQGAVVVLDDFAALANPS